MAEKIFQKHDWKFKIGVILIIFWSIVIGIFNIGVLYLFGIPILGLLIGIIFIWLAKENPKTKFLLSLLPILIIISTFFVMYQLQKAEPEIFLIPQNYRGEFQIQFNEPCGESITYEKSRRIYRIPENGVLILKGSQTLGFIDRKFYLIDEEENLTKLPEFHWSNFVKEKEDWHWLFSSSEISPKSTGIFWAYHNSFSFIVSNYAFIESETKEMREEREKQFHKSADSKLKECKNTQ